MIYSTNRKRPWTNNSLYPSTYLSPERLHPPSEQILTELCQRICASTFLNNFMVTYSLGDKYTMQMWMITDVHYGDVIMGAIASQITSLTIVHSTVYSNADQRKHQSAASLAFVRGIHRGPVNSPHKWPVTRKMFPFDDVIMYSLMSGEWPSFVQVMT